MRPPGHTASQVTEGDYPRTLVLLCRGLEDSASSLSLISLGRWLSDRFEFVEVRPVDDLCYRPQALKGALRKSGAERLVLALCSSDYSEIEIQFHARMAGLDPLSIQAVPLFGHSQSADRAALTNARAGIVLAAAVARARAFPGSRQENLKATWPSTRQRVSRRALFTLPPVSYQTVPSVDQTRCAAADGCDLCVQVCPKTALENDAGSILIDRARCVSCGVCAGTCPRGAIEFPGWSTAEIEAQVSTFLTTVEPNLTARSVAFVCGAATAPVDSEWLQARVPCVSMVTSGAILQTLADGADSVALFTCGDNCKSGLRDEVVGRIDYCRQLLSLLGDPFGQGRVRLEDSDNGPDVKTSVAIRPLTATRRSDAATLFRPGAAALAIVTLAKAFGLDELRLEGPFSPLGVVEVDPNACTGCEMCAANCPTGALSSQGRNNEVILTFDSSLCIGCGECLPLCPEIAARAITMTRVTDLRRLSRGRQVLFRCSEIRCERCGAPIATSRMLERIAHLLGDDYRSRGVERLCGSCRGLP